MTETDKPGRSVEAGAVNKYMTAQEAETLMRLFHQTGELDETIAHPGSATYALMLDAYRTMEDIDPTSSTHLAFAARVHQLSSIISDRRAQGNLQGGDDKTAYLLREVAKNVSMPDPRTVRKVPAMFDLIYGSHAQTIGKEKPNSYGRVDISPHKLIPSISLAVMPMVLRHTNVMSAENTRHFQSILRAGGVPDTMQTNLLWIVYLGGHMVELEKSMAVGGQTMGETGESDRAYQRNMDLETATRQIFEARSSLMLALEERLKGVLPDEIQIGGISYSRRDYLRNLSYMIRNGYLSSVAGVLKPYGEDVVDLIMRHIELESQYS